MSELHTIDSLKSLRETLCVAQQAVSAHVAEPQRHTERIERLIQEIDRQRPLGPDGKHGDRHTPTCGCDDLPPVEWRAWEGVLGYVGVPTGDGYPRVLERPSGELLPRGPVSLHAGPGTEVHGNLVGTVHTAHLDEDSGEIRASGWINLAALPQSGASLLRSGHALVLGMEVLPGEGEPLYLSNTPSVPQPVATLIQRWVIRGAVVHSVPPWAAHSSGVIPAWLGTELRLTDEEGA